MALDVVECCKSVHNQADIGDSMASPAHTGNNGSFKLDDNRQARNAGSHGHFDLPTSSPQAQYQVPASMRYHPHNTLQWQSLAGHMLQGELTSNPSTQIMRTLL